MENHEHTAELLRKSRVELGKAAQHAGDAPHQITLLANALVTMAYALESVSARLERLEQSRSSD